MSEEEEESVSTRPKRISGGVQKPASMGDHEYEERMVTSAEARQMLLGEQVGLMRARLEDQRMHSVEFGNLLCTTFNAMVAVQQEHNVIVREGMATHARLLRTAVATEKKKAATFENFSTGLAPSTSALSLRVPCPHLFVRVP